MSIKKVGQAYSVYYPDTLQVDTESSAKVAVQVLPEHYELKGDTLLVGRLGDITYIKNEKKIKWRGEKWEKVEGVISN